MSRLPFVVWLASTADRDFLDILDWSAEHFGADAANRYEALIGEALIDLGDDPFRSGAKQHPELPQEMFLYPLAGSRGRAAGDRVKAPRHFLLYRIETGRVEVLRILQDSRDLAQHAPSAV
ncbi:MAG: type II toxin-antitoxin system RelE/ParE family toxin [Acidobacteriaceae bacterium]